SRAMAEQRDNWLPTRRSLLARLKNWDDQESWREFFDTYSKLLFRVATKSGLQNADAEDLVQDVIVAVKDAMPDFNYDPALGSFKGWLLTTARRRIIDHVRKQQREPQRDYHPTTETARTPTVHRIPDPKANDFDRLWNEEWEKSIFEAA